MPTGIVKWFSSRKGYGFIIPDDSNAKDIFVHYSEIAVENESQYRALYEGDKVEYNVMEGKNGIEARDVHIIEKVPRPDKK